jgi:peptidoglycan/LPS O-acetylase OafA/YrhL
MPGAIGPSREGEGRDYYYLFDYLRIVLALGVFVGHATHGDVLPPHLGNAFVQVFFALSGFLIGGIILVSTPTDVPRFYFNRCTRIWIPYGIGILLLFVGTALRQNLHDLKLWEFFFYKATFVYNVFGPPQLAAFHDRMPLQGTGNHFWSICVEEQFYLVAPFLLLYAKGLRVPVLIGLVVLNLFWHHAYASATIALGVLLAVSRHHFGAWYLKPWGVAACAAVLLAAVTIMNLSGDLGVYEMAIGPASAAIVALTARPGRAHELGVTLGGMSYPFYLNHWVGLFLRNPLSRMFHLGVLPASGVALACSLALSLIHYRLVDRPIHERRRHWFTRSRGITACRVAILLVVIGLSVGFGIEVHRDNRAQIR